MKRIINVLLSMTLALCISPGTVSASEGKVYAAGTLTNDPLIAEQWALENDGSFKMEEKQNDFSVYDNPFEAPSSPGQWRMPGNSDEIGGRSRNFFFRKNTDAYTEEAITAQAGIDINISDAWDKYGTGSRTAIIALIDTGVDYTHEDLAGSIWVNEAEIAGNGIDDDGNGYIDDVYGWNFYNNSNKVYVSADDDSHGTHGAGTIAADRNNETGIAGIAGGNVKIMIIKVLGGNDGSGTTEDLVRAIEYAEANGADICNLSLCSESDDACLYNAIASSDMLFVCASGNEGEDADSTPVYPACYDLDNIISVANLNYNGCLNSSSNYGAASVDLAAPGSCILSTTPGNSYSYMSGTSMAAPMVSASAAMIYSCFEGITLRDVKDIILNSVTKLDSLSGNTSSGGMLNIGACMSYDTATLSGDEWDEATLREVPESDMADMFMPPEQGFREYGGDPLGGGNRMMPPGGNIPGMVNQFPGMMNQFPGMMNPFPGTTNQSPGQSYMQFRLYSVPTFIVVR